MSQEDTTQEKPAQEEITQAEGEREDSAQQDPNGGVEGSVGDGAAAAHSGESNAPGAEEPVSAGVLSSMNQALEASKLAEQEAQDQLIRMQAEMQNLRRRTERDVEAAHKFALEKFATDLLPVFDSLERGLESVPDDDPTQQAAREGLALTHKLLVDTLARFKVEVVNPQGEPFNPELHEAVSMQPSDHMADNHVLNVFQKGFTLNGRLIRPAMVVVSKG